MTSSSETQSSSTPPPSSRESSSDEDELEDEWTPHKKQASGARHLSTRDRKKPSRFVVAAPPSEKSAISKKKNKKHHKQQKQQRGERYTREQTKLLLEAFEDFCKHPSSWRSSRSSRSKKMHALCDQTGLQLWQISKWFYSRSTRASSFRQTVAEASSVPASLAKTETAAASVSTQIEDAVLPVLVHQRISGILKKPARQKHMEAAPSLACYTASSAYRRYEPSVLMQLWAGLNDYVKDPDSWRYGMPKRIQLAESTGLRDKQIIQYFQNHKKRARKSDMRS